MSYSQWQRIEILIDQGKIQEAEKQASTLLQQDPEDQHGQYLYCIILMYLDRKAEAREMGERLYSNYPLDPYLFLLAQIDLADKLYEPALEKTQNLIEKNPIEASYYALASRVALADNRYDRSLNYINEALRLDPENVAYLNTKLTLDGLLGNQESVEVTLQETLQRAPNDPTSLANLGLKLIREGKSVEAMVHLHKALSIDPMNQLARYVLLEAMKTRFWPYRMLFKMGQMTSRLNRNQSWMLIIGLYFGLQMIGRLAENQPALKPFLTPLIILIVAFFLMSWILESLLNLILLAHPTGKLLLDSDNQKMAYATGGLLAAGILCGVWYFLSGDEQAFAAALLFLGSMIISGTFLKPVQEKYKQRFTMYLAGVVCVGIVGLFLYPSNSTLLYGVAIAIFLYQWILNGILIKEHSRKAG